MIFRFVAHNPPNPTEEHRFDSKEAKDVEALELALAWCSPQTNYIRQRVFSVRKPSPGGYILAVARHPGASGPGKGTREYRYATLGEALDRAHELENRDET